MNGAESLIRTLVNNKVDVCFANPGTSEMHFVAALDEVSEMRAVLGLFEGVCTGAADAYYRMTNTPACTLLHLGPGMANGIANLHNAWRAKSGMINIIGDHASTHLKYDAPLTTDIVGLAKPFSGWIKSSASAQVISQDTADAINAAQTWPGQIATLILPADTAWTKASTNLVTATPALEPSYNEEAITKAAEILKKNEPTLLLMSGQAVINKGLELASCIAQKTGAKLMTNRPTARLQKGAGRAIIDSLAYPVTDALEQLKDYKHIILVGTQQPVAFFGYPDTPSTLAPEGCNLLTLASEEENTVAALEALAGTLNAKQTGDTYTLELPDLPTGELDLSKIIQSVAAELPEQAIIVNEALTSFWGGGVLAHSKPHDMLQNTGGAIGFGMPSAVGAAVACPDRKVINLQADGSAMYTLQALWTQARENLDITTILYNNRAYNILQGELQKVGASKKGQTADQLLNLDNPTLNFVSMAQGMGVEAARAETMEQFNDYLKASLGKTGPQLIEVMV